MGKVLEGQRLDPHMEELDRLIGFEVPPPTKKPTAASAPAPAIVRKTAVERQLERRQERRRSGPYDYRNYLTAAERRALYLQRSGRIQQYLKEFPNGV